MPLPPTIYYVQNNTEAITSQPSKEDDHINTLDSASHDWDQFAADYYAAEQASQVPYVTAVITYLKKAALLPTADQLFLDLGGGTGRFALPLAQQGVKVHVADFSAGMLAVLRQRAVDLTLGGRLTSQQVSWQALVADGRQFAVVFASMLPDLAPVELVQLSQLATQRLLIFRLVSVRDGFFTALWRDLALPPERPEADEQLLTAYEQQRLPGFAAWQHHDFDFTATETLTAAEASEYLATYPEMTPDKLARAAARLRAVLEQGELTVHEHYRFRLLIATRTTSY